MRLELEVIQNLSNITFLSFFYGQKLYKHQDLASYIGMHNATSNLAILGAKQGMFAPRGVTIPTERKPAPPLPVWRHLGSGLAIMPNFNR